MFEYPENLQDEGNGLYSHTEESGQPVTGFSGMRSFYGMHLGIIESEVF
jgi:flagellar hook protein FlgE